MSDERTAWLSPSGTAIELYGPGDGPRSPGWTRLANFPDLTPAEPEPVPLAAGQVRRMPDGTKVEILWADDPEQTDSDNGLTVKWGMFVPAIWHASRAEWTGPGALGYEHFTLDDLRRAPIVEPDA